MHSSALPGMVTTWSSVSHDELSFSITSTADVVVLTVIVCQSKSPLLVQQQYWLLVVGLLVECY